MDGAKATTGPGRGKPKRVLTGSRPSGSPHLGNYFGAYLPSLKLQDQYDFFFFLADFHALNEAFTRDELHSNSLELTATMLALGLDLRRSLFYAQSGVPEVNELAWVLGCQTSYGVMARAHSFKDAQAKGVDINMGVFNYPILMAADILIFDADVVPVGQDQKQHLEMTRDMGQRFNNRYRDVFVIPEPIISEAVAVVPGIDGNKMSKSKGNVVSVFATDAEWKKQVMAIVTDTKGLSDAKDPDTCNVFALYKLVATPEEAADVAAKYRAGGYGYGHAKLALLEKLKERFAQARDSYYDWKKRPDDLIDVIKTGSSKARAIAQAKLDRVQAAVGLLGRPLQQR